MAVLPFNQESQIEWYYVGPGKPIENIFIETINARLRDELLKGDTAHLPRAGPAVLATLER